MEIPTIDISEQRNVAILIIEPNGDTLTTFLQRITKGKDTLKVVANERSHSRYEHAEIVYDPNRFDYVRGSYFVFDDCFADDRWMQDRKLNNLMSHPRTMGITTVIGLRNLPRLPPRMRSNVDILCISKDASNRQQIYESFFQGVFPYEVFCKRLDEASKFLILRLYKEEDQLFVASF